MKVDNVRWGKAILASLLATVAAFGVGFVLYSMANGVYARFGDLPYAKPVESIDLYLLQMLVGGTALNMLWALVYAIIHDGLPGQTRWQKGLAFGLMLLVVNMLPIAFNTWMQIAQPNLLILVEATNRTIGLLVTSLVIAAVYDQPGVAGQTRETGAA